MSRNPNAFHLELAQRIARLIHDESLAPGAVLNEKRLADALGVSRTPVHAALVHLAGEGFVACHPNRGVELLARPPLPGPGTQRQAPQEALLVRIAADRRDGRLADQVSEQDLMQAYQLTRSAVKQALTHLARLGVVEAKLGYRWKFLDGAYDDMARAEAFRFRILVEPSALTEPGYALAPAWVSGMVAQHQAFLDARWQPTSGVAFFEMNANFHEGLVKASGNRFFFESIQRLNRLRRLSNYDWKHGRLRADLSCREHLQILELLRTGDRGHAALMMRQHLGQAKLVNSCGSPGGEAQ